MRRVQGRAVRVLAVVAPVVFALAGGGIGTPTATASPPACAGSLSSPPRHDFNNDGYSDVVIGAGSATIDGAAGAGAVAIIPGGPGGPTVSMSSPDLFLHEGGGTGGVLGTPEAGDEFGGSVAWGDFNGDGCDDLAIGAPGEGLDGSTHPGAGIVVVLYGSPTGLDVTAPQLIEAGSPGVGGVVTTGAKFGRALAGGDFDGDGFDDLAIGSSGDPVNGQPGAGAVYVLDGSAGGLVGHGMRITQDTPGVEGAAEAGDHFGERLTTGRFNAGCGVGTFASLVVSAPDEDLGSVRDAGAVSLVPGSSSGLHGAGSQLLYEGLPGSTFGPAVAFAKFGAALAVGRIGRDSLATLVIGAPGNSDAGVAYAGGVYVVPSQCGFVVRDAHRLAQGTPGVEGDPVRSDGFGSALAVGDYNADHDPDIAVGTPFKDVPHVVNAGSVTMLWGRPWGVSGQPSTVFVQGGNPFDAKYSVGAEFGETLIAGNFDHELGTDLEVAMPGQSFVSDTCPATHCTAAGAVDILRDVSGTVFVTRSELPGAGADERGDRFGSTTTP